MKNNQQQLVKALILMVITTAFYRIIPGRPYGFAPQIAVAIFAGSLLKNNKAYSFILPLVSMLVSDGIYQVLYLNGLSEIQGFYSGQWENYLIIIALTCFGFFVQQKKISSIVLAAVAAPTVYFLISNMLVWAGGGGYHRPQTVNGLLLCLEDGLPFYQFSLLSTLVFSSFFFGIQSMVSGYKGVKKLA